MTGPTLPPAPASGLIALPRLAFRVGVSGAAKLDEVAQERLRPEVAAILGQVRAELEALACDARAKAAYLTESDAALRPSLRIVSPLAEGADRLVAEEALRLDYTLEALLPFEQRAYEATFPDSIAEFQILLRRASRVLILDGDSGDAIVRGRSYGEAGRLVARNCDLLIAVWDNTKPAKGPGGTADTVRFAVHAGVPVWWLHADGEAEPRLLADMVHLAQPEDAPAGSAALQAWLHQRITDAVLPPEPTDEKRSGLFAFTANKMRVWRRLETDAVRIFLNEAVQGNDWLWRAHNLFLGPPRPARSDPSRSAPPSHPAARLSRQYQARYRSSYFYVFVAAAFALLAAVIGLAFPNAKPFTAPIELTMLLCIFWLVLINHVWRWHERYLSYRLLAELFRVQRRMAALGWTLPALNVSDVAVHAGRRWVSWYFAATVRGTPITQGTLKGEQLVAAQQEARNLVTEQIGFHEQRRRWKDRSGRALERWGEGLFMATLCVVAVEVILLFPAILPAESRHTAVVWLGLFAALLPAVSAALFGLRAYEEMEALSEQSELMVEALRRAEMRIATIRLDRPLASQLLAAEVFGVVTLMLADADGWAQLFRMKAIGTG